MPARMDLLGKRFGKWRVLSEAPRKPGSPERLSFAFDLRVCYNLAKARDHNGKDY